LHCLNSDSPAARVGCAETVAMAANPAVHAESTDNRHVKRGSGDKGSPQRLGLVEDVGVLCHWAGISSGDLII